MRIMKIFILGLLIPFSFCKKPQFEPTPLPTYGSPKPTIIWKQLLSEDSSYNSSIDPLLFGDLIITSAENSGGGNEKILAFNKETGDLVWSWDDYLSGVSQSLKRHQSIIIDNSLIVTSFYDNYSINIESGVTNWGTNDLSAGGPRISNFNNTIFHTRMYGSSPHRDSSDIMMCDYLTGNWQKLFTINNVDNFSPHIEPPAGYINQDGETLLIFQNRGGVITSYFDDRVDLYCYNVDQDSIVWLKEDFTPSGSSNVNNPIVEGDRVYFGGKWDFYCIDIPSGEVLWTHNFYHDFQGSNFVIYNDLIIIDLDNGDLIAINKNNGNQAWVNEGLSGCCTELRIYGDRIYFGNSNLFIANASNGNKLYEFESPHSGGSFHNAIAVDLINNKMYTTDGYYLMCMELPE